MTDLIDTAALRALAAAATPGPWVSGGGRFDSWIERPDGLSIFDKRNAGTAADVEFVVAARSVIPALCDVVDELRRQLARMIEQNLGRCDSCNRQLVLEVPLGYADAGGQLCRTCFGGEG